jgi:enoyl-CoA hydratase
LTTDSDLLLVERDHFVCTLTLNRPEKRNSLSPALLEQLTETLQALSVDDSVRTLIIRGAGDKVFCAGYDLGAISVTDSGAEEQMTTADNPFERAMDAIIRYPYPVIAQVNGHAFGGGCDLVATCDIRVGADDVKMGMVPAKLGVVYSLNGLRRFTSAVGLNHARQMFFTGRTYSADDLHHFGLLDYRVPRPELGTFTRSLAAEIAANAPLSLKGIKHNLNILTHAAPIDPDLRQAAERLVREAFLSADFKEGQNAFFEKRTPQFNGR